MVSTVHRLTTKVVVKILNIKASHGEDSMVTSVHETTAAAGVDETVGEQQQGSSDRRRRRRTTAPSHHVQLVAVDPAVRDNRLRTAIVVTDPGQYTAQRVDHGGCLKVGS